MKARVGNVKAKDYLVEAMLLLSEYMWTYNVMENLLDADFDAKQFMLAHVEATILVQHEFFDSWSFLQGKNLLKGGYAYYTLLNDLGYFKQADELCQVMLNASSRHLGGRTTGSPPSIHDLSRYLQIQEKTEKDEMLIRKRVAVELNGQDDTTVETLQSMFALSELLISQGKYDDANKTLQEGADTAVSLLGRDHRDTVSIIKTQAEILWVTGQYTEAELMNKENLLICRKDIC